MHTMRIIYNYNVCIYTTVYIIIRPGGAGAGGAFYQKYKYTYMYL